MRPFLMRWWAATTVGVWAVSFTPLRTVASAELSSTSGSKAARAETPVRRASMGMAIFDYTEDLDNIIGNSPAGAEGRVKIVQLLPGGQGTKEKQVDYFFKCRLLGQVVDVIAAI